MNPSVKIDQRIVGFSVQAGDAPPAPPPVTVDPEPQVVVIAAKPYARPDTVRGTTYKIRPATMSSALYVTINDIVLEDGSRRPIEIFINTKHVEHFQWITGMTRMISALFRKPGEFEFLIDELLQVFDPQGGYWEQGKMVPSVVAHIGLILREHCRELGLIEAPQLNAVQQAVLAEKKAAAEAQGIKGQRCARCSESAVVLIDGCLTCLNCGDSKCG